MSPRMSGPPHRGQPVISCLVLSASSSGLAPGPWSLPPDSPRMGPPPSAPGPWRVLLSVSAGPCSLLSCSDLSAGLELQSLSLGRHHPPSWHGGWIPPCHLPGPTERRWAFPTRVRVSTVPLMGGRDPRGEAGPGHPAVLLTSRDTQDHSVTTRPPQPPRQPPAAQRSWAGPSAGAVPRVRWTREETSVPRSVRAAGPRGFARPSSCHLHDHPGAAEGRWEDPRGRGDRPKQTPL